MNKIFIYLIALYCSASHAFGQDLLGPKLMAMGNNGAAVKDIWSTTANVAGITIINVPTLALNYAPYYYDSELSKQALAVVLPLKKYHLGIDLQRYGVASYNEIKVGFVCAKNFGETLSIGIKVNYHQIKINNYGSSTAYSVDAGLFYLLNQRLTLGLYLNNPSGQNYSHQALSATIPNIIHLGMAYQVSDKVLVATTLNKDFDRVFDMAIGIDYKLIALMSLRTGLTMKPFKQYAGLAFEHKKLTLAMAVENDPNIGYSPQIAVAYAF